ncbi:hypothetical protein BJX65DRAFT_276546 [Aspergillus insuetus]
MQHQSRHPSMECTLIKLPLEIHLEIGEYLLLTDLPNLFCTCKFFARIHSRHLIRLQIVWSEARRLVHRELAIGICPRLCHCHSRQVASDERPLAQHAAKVR